jgi:isochorismate hydrolase
MSTKELGFELEVSRKKQLIIFGVNTSVETKSKTITTFSRDFENEKFPFLINSDMELLLL